jgi:hypothetical protein
VGSSRERSSRWWSWRSSPDAIVIAVSPTAIAAWRLSTARAEVVRRGEQVVAQDHRGLVAPQRVDGLPAPADLRVVEHVVVDERRHVDHLDDGPEADVLVGPERGQVIARARRAAASGWAASPVSRTSVGRSILPR